ncbi:MAG TPA: alkaline phosphatase family protein, partial [Solirubrobacteraceae bacterium]
GTAPVKLAVSPDGQTLYSADSGEDAVAAISLTARPQAGVPVIPRRVARPVKLASLIRYHQAQRRAAAALSTALAHAGSPSARSRARRRYAAALRNRRWLQIRTTRACAGPTVQQMRTYIRAVLRDLGIRSRRRRGQRLAQARRRLPAIRACRAAPGYLPNLPALHLIGRLPTAAYPDDVQVTPDGSHLLWVAGKGFGSGPNPNYFFAGDKRPGVTPTNVYGTYVLDKLTGRVGELPTPSDIQMSRSSALANAQVVPQNAEARPAGSPIPAPGQGPSTQIKHVFYIVRENRTYDQVFGTDARGDGAPSLELFADNGVGGPTGGITPNAHSLARQFPLLDHFYADSEVSVDGHLITAGAYATDYVQKALAANYSNRNRGDDFGIYPVTFPPNDFVVDQAVRQGVSFRNYGEQAVGASPLGDAPNRPTYSEVAANTDYSYPNNLFIGCLTPGNPATCTQDSGIYKTTGRPIAGQSRFNTWYPEFQAQVASGTVPTLNYMILPNDHTNGTTAQDFTPQAMIADNDLALGQIVDAISHSSIWSSSAIFVVEDDSQDGADHVDAHRMPAFVISPWARHGAVVHTRYDQYSMLRTVELIAGLAPLSLNDGLATPMYDAFVSGGAGPDNTPYNVVAPTQDIGQRNGASAPLARQSGRLPWNRIDMVPQEISDATLWAAIHGAYSRPPRPGPNASPVEHQRALLIRALLARHRNVRRALAGHRGDG